jgi:murein DD-endopeptidase MepM/ murein hydrolase activator NlpD
MSSTCRVCGRPADPFRDRVEVVGMRVEVVCRACAEGAAPAATPPAPEPSAPAPAPTLPRPAAAGPARKEVVGLVLVLIIAGASVGAALALRARRKPSAAATPNAASSASSDAAPRKSRSIRTISEGTESDPGDDPPAGLQAVLDGRWTHPLVGPFREMPPNETTRFGAYRSREVYKHKYCGSGHCGVDLGNKVGLPIVAAREGVLERVVRAPTEVEGKWLKILHPGGLHTYYMHLDEVSPELVQGGSVSAGQMIGILGTTGIKRSEPHLHFMISFDAANGKELFVDPEPLVREAELVEISELPGWGRRSAR